MELLAADLGVIGRGDKVREDLDIVVDPLENGLGELGLEHSLGEVGLGIVIEGLKVAFVFTVVVLAEDGLLL